MTVMHMEQRKETEVPAKTFCYSIPQLTEIGRKTQLPADISRFSVDAIQVGIVTGRGHVPKPITMPLGERPLNRDRGWSIDSLDSMEDCVVFPGSASTRPSRQPRNAPSEARAQSDDGFARFLKQHSSPTHQRVTAGGRIVPMEPIPAPPQFNLLIGNLARDKGNMNQQQSADSQEIGSQKIGSQEIGNKCLVPVVNTAAPANVDLPPAQAEHSQQTFMACQGQDHSAGQISKMNTTAGELENGNHMPRSSYLDHLTSTNSFDLSQTFTNFSSLFNLNPQALTQNQLASLALPLSGMVFNPYTNMLTPVGEQQPMMPTSVVSNTPSVPVTGVNQMNVPVTRGGEIDRFVQESHQTGFLANYNRLLPANSTGNMQPSYPSSLSVNDGMTSIASTLDPQKPQIGTHPQAGYQGQVSAPDMRFSSMTTNHLSAQPSKGMACKVTERDVACAGTEFRQLDNQLRGHDQFTARHHASFSPHVKSYYVKERMILVEKRDMARRKFNQLRDAVDQENLARCKVPCPVDDQQAWSTKGMTLAPTQKNSNTNLNVQAAAWVPGQVNQSSGVHAQPQSQPKPMVSIEARAPNINKSATGSFKTGAEQASFAQQVSMQVLNPVAKQQNMRSIISSATPPGPYTKQLSNPDRELSDQEVDEWGVRRGFAPPQLSQKQREEAMELLSQKRARDASASANRQCNQFSAGQSALDDESPPYPVDEWGARLGRAPPELAKHQNEQFAKLAKMNPNQRSQISLATLDSLHTAKTNGGKTVKFAESIANTTYPCRYDPNDEASSVGSTDGIGWRPMKPGKAPLPTQNDWQAICDAGNQEKGLKTEVFLVTGQSIVVEGKGPSDTPSETTDDAQNSDGGCTYKSGTEEEERSSVTTQLLSIEKGIRGLETSPRMQSTVGFPLWAYQDENNHFRNKGASSVALQSVTAQGMLPGFDGGFGGQGQKSLTPISNIDQQADSSALTSGTPPMRSLRDIWGMPRLLTHVEAADEEEDMSDVKTIVGKY